MEIDYKALYYQLFAALADCTAAFEAQNYGVAREILIKAQQAAEDTILKQDEP